MSLVSKVLASKIHGLLYVALAMEKEGFVKEACAAYAMVGKMLPGKVCIESFSAKRVKFFLPEAEPEVSGWKELFGGKPFLIMGAR